MVNPTRAAIRRLNDRVKQQVTDTGTIHAIDGDRVDLRIGTSPNVVRNVQVAGSLNSLAVGQTVAFTRVDGRPLVLAGGDGGGGGSSSATYLTINQTDGTLPEHQHSGVGDGGVLNNYVITANHAAPGMHTLGINVPHDDHGNLAGLGDDDHAQYLTTGRHDLDSRHSMINHHVLQGLGDDDHLQYLNNARHDVDARHTAINHHVFQGLLDDDHTQYLNNTRHDVNGRHTMIDHHVFQGLGDDDHLQYVHISGPRTITAVHTFAPETPGEPFHLGYLAQGHTVEGLRADELNKSITAGNGLTGGGDLTASRTITLGTPSTLDLTTTNGVTGTTHTHAIGASSDPGAASALLKTDANGLLKLWNLTVNNALTLGGSSTISSGNFASGISGWQIRSTGDAEFNNLTARGEFSSVRFASREVAAISGALGVFPASGTLAADVTTVAGPSTFTLDIKDPKAGHIGAQFSTSSLLRLKSGGLDNWMTVTAVDSGQTGFYRYTCVLQSGTPGTFNAGTAVVDYGASGSGFLLMRADDTYSPFLSVATHAGSPWSAQTEHVRLGNLSGWGSANLTGYGIGIGNYAAGESLYYTPAAGLNIQGTVKADDGYLKNLDVSGLLSVGTTGELRAGDINNGLRLGYFTDGYYFRGVGGGETQVEIRASDGKLYAGDGTVRLDKDGISLEVDNSETWQNQTSLKWGLNNWEGPKISGTIWAVHDWDTYPYDDSLDIMFPQDWRTHNFSVSLYSNDPDAGAANLAMRSYYGTPSELDLSAHAIHLGGDVFVEIHGAPTGATQGSFGGKMHVAGDLGVGGFPENPNTIIYASSGGQIETRYIYFKNDSGQQPFTIQNSMFSPITNLDSDKLDGQHGSYYAGWRTSTNRPGVTKLYRSDSDDGYNVQTWFNGSRWVMQGYNAAGTYHAPVQVGYADNANTLDGLDSTAFAAASHSHSGRYVPLSTIGKPYSAPPAGGVGTYNIPVTSYGVPSGAVAVHVVIGGRWATVAASSYVNCIPYGGAGSDQSVVLTSQSAGNLWVGGNVRVGSDNIQIIVAGANPSVFYFYILGYYTA